MSSGARSIAAVRSIGGYGAQCHKTRIAGTEIENGFFGSRTQVQPRGVAHAVARFEVDIHDSGAKLNIHALRHKPSLHGHGYRVILVVNGATPAREGVHAREFLDESQEVSLEFDSAVPDLEGKSSAPHLPEVGLEKMIGEHLVDAARAKKVLRQRQKTCKFDPVSGVEAV